MGTDNIDSTIEKLNQTALDGWEDVLTGDVLYYPLQAMPEIGQGSHGGNGLLHRLKWGLRILNRLMICQYRYHKTVSHGTLFLFSSSYGEREDHRRAFQTVVNLSGDGGYAMYNGETREWSFRKLKEFRRILKWNKTLKNAGICKTGTERGYLLLSMVKVYCDYKDAERFFGSCFKDIDILVSWCDIHPVDAFFTQKFQAMGKKTVDLMHGALSTAHNSWSVYGIKSDYFIADCKYTKDMLINNGYQGTVFVCGYPYGIEEPDMPDKEDREKIVGVIFAGEVMHQDNLAMCRGLAGLRDAGCEIIVKMHPSESAAAYGSDLDGIVSELYGTEISATDFLGKISHAVLAPSTVVYETIRNRIPFLFFADRLGYYKQFEMPAGLTADSETLPKKAELLLNGKLDHISEDLCDYYTAPGNVKENYKGVFREIGILK